jgi:hypothetical protein
MLYRTCIGNGRVAAMVIGKDQSLVAYNFAGTTTTKNEDRVFKEDLLTEYSCSLVSLSPLFTISLYTCSPNNMGSHMPSSALAFNSEIDNTIAKINFFISF